MAQADQNSTTPLPGELLSTALEMTSEMENDIASIRQLARGLQMASESSAIDKDAGAALQRLAILLEDSGKDAEAKRFQITVALWPFVHGGRLPPALATEEAA